MEITYYGHSCFGVKTKVGINLLFDPYITSNKLASMVDVKSIKADYILISHGHYDHIEDAVDIAKRTKAKVIANYEICEWLEKKGIKDTYPMNLGGSWVFDFAKIKYVYAAHSSVLPDGTYGGVAGGFLVETKYKNFYFAGDTGLHNDMKLIGEFKCLDFAILPIGDIFTMGIDNAIIASEFINCNHIFGMHYDTSEKIKIDKNRAYERFSSAGKKLELMEINKTIEI